MCLISCWVVDHLGHLNLSWVILFRWWSYFQEDWIFGLTFEICFDVWKLFWRLIFVLTFEICFDVWYLFWRLKFVLTSEICFDLLRPWSTLFISVLSCLGFEWYRVLWWPFELLIEHFVGTLSVFEFWIERLWLWFKCNRAALILL